MASLSSARAKLDRAKEHIQLAKEVSKTFLNSDFYRLASRPQKNGNNRHFVILKRLDSYPPRFGLLIGDAVHNLRASLDHIAYALAKKTGGNEDRNIFFPLLTSRKKRSLKIREHLPGVSRQVRAAVQRFQPYHGRKGSDTKVLGQVKALDDWDKHRSMLVAGAGNVGPRFHVITHPETPILRMRTFYADRPLKRDAVLARFQLAKTEEQPNMDVAGHLQLFPVFGDGMPKEVRNAPVWAVLGRAAGFIEKVIIPTFEKL